MNIGVNFFGPKRKLYHDFDGTLENLMAGGFNSAEICVAFGGAMEPPKGVPEEVFREISGGIWDYSVADERLAAVRAKGMAVISVHMMIAMRPTPEQLEAVIPTVVEFGKRNQIHYFVLSIMKGLPEMKN